MTVKEVLRVHARTRAVHARTQGAHARTQGARAGTQGARAECGNATADAGAGDVGMRVEGEGGPTSSAAPAATVAAGRAAQELGIRRAEFELAVHLGLIAVVGAPGGGRPRVHEEEIARLREQPGFPDGLAERVRTVGTAEGAALLDIAPARFTRLARAGCVSPVTFYLNRYRAVVWLYLADELAAFASREPELLAGRTPLGMRTMLESGADWRPRNWRSQRIDRLLSRTEDPWARTAVQASALDPVQLAEVVDDPYERAYLVRVRPEPVFGRPGSMAAREAMGELMLADDPDEILWRRVNLTLELDAAREDRPAPRPGDDGGIRTAPVRAGARTGTAAPASAAEPTPPSVRPGASGSAAAGVPTGKGLLARLGWRGRGAG
ncbi:hypothetical protein PZ61_0200730 [Streptomyces sp. MNU77]|uniref:DUF6397 family protein n=1 Tax=Streptomyces sp. MNU77 TaxID=1573406 RepID=UPI0005DCC4AB|nr:DUF6397 family protein [Streptomyces sp. MNU77]OLO29169.1 hypothetical protein PZ61_0200730 [Streptomyces sp. MNU77]